QNLSCKSTRAELRSNLLEGTRGVPPADKRRGEATAGAPAKNSAPSAVQPVEQPPAMLSPAPFNDSSASPCGLLPLPTAPDGPLRPRSAPIVPHSELSTPPSLAAGAALR